MRRADLIRAWTDLREESLTQAEPLELTHEAAAGWLLEQHGERAALHVPSGGWWERVAELLS